MEEGRIRAIMEAEPCASSQHVAAGRRKADSAHENSELHGLTSY